MTVQTAPPLRPLDPEILDASLTFQQFRDRAEVNADVLDEVRSEPDVTAGELEMLLRLPPLRLVAIGEDWCPDVVHTLPTWDAVCSELDGWSIHVFPRDEHDELMQAFLWKGEAKRIPVYAFFDQRGHLQTWWSGRGATAEARLKEWLAGRSFADLDDDEKKAIGERLDKGYREGFRRENFREILDQLRAFYHLGPEAA